jgi:rsbT co-antagonist protein RsbR
MPQPDLAPLTQRMEARFYELVERLTDELPRVSAFYGALPHEARRTAAVNLYTILRDSVEEGGVERFGQAIMQIARNRIAQGGTTDDLRAATALIREINLSLIDELAHTQPDAAVPAFAWLDRVANVALRIFSDLAQEELTRQAKELAILMALIEQAEQAEQADDLVAALFEQLPQLGIDWAIISLRADDAPALHELVGVFDPQQLAANLVAGERFSPEPLLQAITPDTACMPLHAAELGLLDAQHQRIAPNGIGTVVALPLRGRRGIYGLLVLGYIGERQLTSDEQHFLVSIVSPLRNRLLNLRLVQQLREQVERAMIFQTLIEQTGDMVVLTDLTGVVTYANSAGAQLLEIDSTDMLVGRFFNEVIDEADRARMGEEVPLMFAAGRSWQGSYTLASASGQRIPVTSNVITLRNSTGEPLAIGGITHDERERLAMVETLRRANQQQQQILDLLRQLSTPLVPVMDGILVMPLVGEVDDRRAAQVLETLLEGVSRSAADVVIIDITGVPIVDTSVANALIQAARATRLLGAEALLVGITPDVAQTLVGLGIDLHSLITRGDLQSGIAYALKRRGFRIVPHDASRAIG